MREPQRREVIFIQGGKGRTSAGKIKSTLDALYQSYAEDFRRSPQDFFLSRRDPVLFPHRYSHPDDIEASAFLAATFAYGNVSSLCAFVERLLSLLGPSPSEFLKNGNGAIDELVNHRPYYRLQKTAEIIALLRAMSCVYQNHVSLYRVFLKSYEPKDSMKQNASRFVNCLQSYSESSLRFLVPSPADGSPCKRLNLFFRWMVRRDGIDFGLWKEISPAELIMPIDTHIGRIAYRLGWIRTPSLSWQKAEQVTEILRKFDPDDPTRYDFSLCHESISKTPWFQSL